MMRKPFNLLDRVEWESQAKGTTIAKSGVVMQVVPPGIMPCKELFPDLYTNGIGGVRSERSYVVRAAGKHYWPRTSHLFKSSSPNILRLVPSQSVSQT